MKLNEMPDYLAFRRPGWDKNNFWPFDVSDEGVGEPYLRAYTLRKDANKRQWCEPKFNEAEVFLAKEDLNADDYELCEGDEYRPAFLD